MAEMGFTLQPEVYITPPGPSDLGAILDELWDDAEPEASIYIASAFVDQNGVLPVVKRLKAHVEAGGDVRCFFAGSPSQNMASRQAVTELLSLPASVMLLNRKKIFHTKMYGVCSDNSQSLVLSSGNFTGNGLALNIESSLAVGPRLLAQMGFSWQEWERRLREQFEWQALSLKTAADPKDPTWRLTFDEARGRAVGQEEADTAEDEVIVFSLSPTDVNRIQSKAYPGTAYFWLSRYMSGYFPPLQIRSKPGAKKTFSTDIEVDFADVGRTETVTVTFEAYNNLDFRLLVGPLRGTKVARAGDLVVLDRRGLTTYKLKVIDQTSRTAARIRPYLVNFIGHKGKRWGTVPRRMLKGIV